MVNTHETVASTVLDNSHDEEPLWEKILSLPGRGTFEHSSPDFFRPIFLAFSTTIISEQRLNFVDGYIIQPHVKSTNAAGPGLGGSGGPAIGPARRAGVKAGRLHNNKKILLCLGPVAQKCLGPVVHKQQIPRPRARPRAVTTINCFFQYNNIYKFAY